jgi:hypothetical protein
MAINIAPFEASRLKIDRARSHLHSLGAEITAYMAKEPFALIVEDWELNAKVKTGFESHAWVVRIKEDVPKHFSAIIGDTVHNLCAALDLIACDLVRLNGRSAKDVHFPFCDGQADLTEMVRRRNLHKAGPQVVSLIESLQPYRGGNSLLRAIHDFDIIDKHQTILPVLAGGTSPEGLISFFGNDPTMVPAISSRIRKAGQYLMVMPPVSNLPIGTKLPARWHLVFDANAEPFSGYDIVKLLHEFCELVNGIVEMFAGKFGGAAFPSKD